MHLNVHSLQQRIWIANHIIQLKHTVRLKIKNVLQMHMFVKIFFKKKLYKDQLFFEGEFCNLTLLNYLNNNNKKKDLFNLNNHFKK